MINKYIVGNMKMNLTLNDVKEYTKLVKPVNNFYICPTHIYIPFFINMGYNTCIQNVSEYDSGAYTGEVSAMQAVSMGIKLSIIGHSERRKYFNETDDVINKKINKALLSGIDVILCVGETLVERNSDQTKIKLQRQLIEDLKGFKNEELKHIIIAYEPIWAIGTGNTPSINDIEDITNYIKQTTQELYNANIKVLYGGSVDENNIEELNNINNLDGYLIGGACLKPEKINKIIETVNR